MSILSGGLTDFFGLDLGMSAIRVVQLKGAGPVKSLGKYGQVLVAGTLAASDAPADRTKLSAAVAELVKRSEITTKNVVVNLPSNRVFTTVIDMEKMSPAELATTINYQANSLIPTPLAESKLDWAEIGPSPKDPSKVEVLLSSTPNAYIEARLDMLEAIGLNVIAFEPDNMALVRALIQNDSTLPQMIVDIGSNNTDIVIAMAGIPHLSRAIPVGWRTMINAAVQSLNIDATQAQQFVFKFGVGKDKLEGQIYNAIICTVDNLMLEIDKSIKFFAGRYPQAKLDRIIVTGGASTLPELPLYIANKFGINVEIGNAWRNVDFPPEKQSELMSLSSHFGVAAGLAERRS